MSNNPDAARRGLLIILSSPSGAGKSTLAARLRCLGSDIEFFGVCNHARAATR
jgi:guanylate kinase